MATKRRLKNADEAMMGPKPSFGIQNPIPDDLKEREKLFRNGCHWFYYFENKKKAAETVQIYCRRVLKFDKKKIANLKKLPDWKYRMKTYKIISMINNGWEGYPLTEDMVNEMHEMKKTEIHSGS